MLAAAVFFDLIPTNFYASFGSDVPPFPVAIVTEDGVKFRHQIPTQFEPALFKLVGEEVASKLGVRASPIEGTPPSYNPELPEGAPLRTIDDLYGSLLNSGSTRYLGWLNGNGPGPMDHDLDVVLQAVNQFANQPEFANQPVQVREAFAASLAQSLYNNEAFTTYGKALQQFSPPAVEVP
ncbi:MAG: hypothetical protein P8J89_05100 [Phycisphaerales bacterium]|nr:hypothetical protein [Phycisphaerales bacterium]